METYTRFFRAAGITVQLNSEVPIAKNTLEPKFSFFETDGPGEDNIVIRHFLSDIPKPEVDKSNDLKTVLDDGTWKISISDSICIYRYNSEEWSPIPYSVTNMFDKEHSHGKIYFSGINRKQYGNLRLASLTGLATDQILMSKLLADRNGFLFHSNGVSLSGKTLLFTGKSGAGKSTISGLIKKNGGKIFCDDRIIMQKDNADFFASGSWIHPGVTSASLYTEKVDAVFFIEQADHNMITPITKITKKYEKAIKALVKNFFMTDQWNSTLGLVDDFVQKTPFYSLKFNLTNEIYTLISQEIQLL
ncbi:MAG: hypothetical protein H8D87_05610 [Deltaproteobacteria bacterium]|uniref:hypothetical protein n=1 Tax=Desulfobacula sp. TaxID=2593537 RepID=UPI0019A8C5A1|nr:hypothetical protein [Candidatus Desulfobacula maris]MBL6995185.1 hypothetical protein [Desulfobacula sp.]